MNWRRLTGIILVVGIVLVAIYDVCAAAFGQHATISEITLATAKGHPVIPFALGVVCGHLFWPQKDKTS